MKAKKLSHLSWAATLFLIAGILNGCGSTDVNGQGAGRANTEGDIETRFPTAVSAEGWKEARISTRDTMPPGGTDMELDIAGHFTLSPNYCYKRAWGAVRNIEAWNNLAAGINTAISLEMRPEDQEKICVPRATSWMHFNESLKVKLEDGRSLTLLEGTWGGDICSRIPDRQVVEKMTRALDAILPMAYVEDCVRPRPQQ